jgi:hypothetical protein
MGRRSAAEEAYKASVRYALTDEKAAFRHFYRVSRFFQKDREGVLKADPCPLGRQGQVSYPLPAVTKAGPSGVGFF